MLDRNPGSWSLGPHRRCVALLLKQPLDDVEIVVVDDASRDDTADVMTRYADRVTICTLETSAGFAGACNAGARAATSDLLLFLNSDTLPQPGWLDAMIEHLGVHTGTAVVGAKLAGPTASSSTPGS